MTRVYAHRGASAELPENTLPSFRRALELGADALELDVHATQDGVLVVSHDPDGARLCGVPRPIAASSLAEVQSWDAGAGFASPDGTRPHARRGIRIPTLEEVVVAFRGVPLNVDLKAPAPELAVALLRRLGAEQQVTLASFQASTLRRVRALGYAGPTGLGRSEVAALLALPAAAQRGPLRCAGTAAQLPVSLAQPWVVQRCHRLGLRVDFWTANDEATARRLVALRVDGIMTDDPARIVPAVRAADAAATPRA